MWLRIVCVLHTCSPCADLSFYVRMLWSEDVRKLSIQVYHLSLHVAEMFALVSGQYQRNHCQFFKQRDYEGRNCLQMHRKS